MGGPVGPRKGRGRTGADETGEKRDLLLKARFDALQSEGKTALKKAMDRKRKKVAGKEKKSRPNVRRAT